MELSQFSSVLTAQHKTLLVIGALVTLYLAIVLLERYLKGKTTGLKDDTLNIDVEAQEGVRALIGLGMIVFSMVIFYKFPSELTVVGLFLSPFVARMYWNRNLALGVYKNGKFLGNIYKGFIRVEDGLTLGKRQGGTIGYLKVKKDGEVVALLTLTPEAFMELKPEKIHEVFPEIKGNIEKFKDLFKVGDYTLQYSLFTRSYGYKGSYGYEGGYQSHSSDDYDELPTGSGYTNHHDDYIFDHTYSSFDHSSDWFFDPAYSSFEGNIYHND